MYRKYSYDTNYFKQIDTPEKAYFLGLLYADGCITKGSLKITLTYEDGYILDKLIESMEYTGKIFIRDYENCKPKYELAITRRELINDMQNLGMYPNKTFNVSFPSFLTKEFNSHFIRGFFDGDGCITKGKTFAMSFTSQFSILKPIENFLLFQMPTINKGIYTKRHKEKDDGVYSLCFNGNIPCLQSFVYMYNNAEGLFLKRKFLRFKELIDLMPTLNYNVGHQKHKKDIMLNSLEQANDIYNKNVMLML